MLILGAPAAMVMAQDQDEATKAELKKLEGSWKVVSMQMAGKNEALEGKKLVFTFKGDKMIQSFEGNELPPGTIKINAKADPKHLDMIASDGPNKGKPDMSVYILDGDTLKIAGYAGDTSLTKRPTTFPKDGDPEMDIFVLKREKI
jgi:uncharacterized protein (TIGR03067 family)